MTQALYTAHRNLENSKMMILGPDHESTQFDRVGSLEKYLRPSDLLVFNVSATLPSSFRVRSHAGAEPFEIRLASFAGSTTADLSIWWAIAFGPGDWRSTTEERTEAPLLKKGHSIQVLPFSITESSSLLEIQILEVDSDFSRLMKIKFRQIQSAPQVPLASLLFTYGKPIQYSYHQHELAIWNIQTILAQVPISVEAPSSLFSLDWRHLLNLKNHFECVFMLHGAGISSTGEAKLDLKLPFPEFFEFSKHHIDLFIKAKNEKRRIIAIGTSAARAVESAFDRSEPILTGFTDLRLGSGRDFKMLSGLLTGFHELTTSHFEIEQAFHHDRFLRQAHNDALSRGFIGHEYGDSILLLRDQPLFDLIA